MLFDEFTQQYALSKTLRFALRPVGKTAEHIQRHGLLVQDEQRAEDYKQAKKIIDEYHKWFIEQRLSGFSLDNGMLQTLADIYNALQSQKNRNDDALKEKLKTLQNKLRQSMANCFKGGEGEPFGNNFYQEVKKKPSVLIEWIQNHHITIEDIDNPIAIIKRFKGWTTYFKGFEENRKNIYTDKAHSTAIAYRIIHENLPKFLDNCKNYQNAKDLGVDFSTVKRDLRLDNVEALFEITFFNECLTQSGIDNYNEIIGGKTLEDGTKLQGINESINLFAQQIEHKKARANDEDKKGLEHRKKAVRACKMQLLYKQILSDREGSSFRPEGIQSDQELCRLLADFAPDNITYTDDSGHQQNILDTVEYHLKQLQDSNLEQIYIKNDQTISDISQAIFSDWAVIKRALEFYVDQEKLSTDKKGIPKTLNQAQKEKWLKKPYLSFQEIVSALKAYLAQEEVPEHLISIKNKTKDKNIDTLLIKYFQDLRTTAEKWRSPISSPYQNYLSSHKSYFSTVSK